MSKAMSDELKDFLFTLLSSIIDITDEEGQEDDDTYYIRAEKSNYVGFISEDTKVELEEYLEALCH